MLRDQAVCSVIEDQANVSQLMVEKFLIFNCTKQGVSLVLVESFVLAKLYTILKIGSSNIKQQLIPPESLTKTNNIRSNSAKHLFDFANNNVMNQAKVLIFTLDNYKVK